MCPCFRYDNRVAPLLLMSKDGAHYREFSNRGAMYKGLSLQVVPSKATLL